MSSRPPTPPPSVTPCAKGFPEPLCPSETQGPWRPSPGQTEAGWHWGSPWPASPRPGAASGPCHRLRRLSSRRATPPPAPAGRAGSLLAPGKASTEQRGSGAGAIRSFVSAISQACAMNTTRKACCLRPHATSKPRGHPGGSLRPGRPQVTLAQLGPVGSQLLRPFWLPRPMPAPASVRPAVGSEGCSPHSCACGHCPPAKQVALCALTPPAQSRSLALRGSWS